MNVADMNDEQYGLLHDVRRSLRYHDRRRAFFDGMHQLTAVLTVLLAGSVLFDLAKPGASPPWLQGIALAAALLSAVDLVAGYSPRAARHLDLKRRFGALEIAILGGGADAAAWAAHRSARLLIEQDEPPVYRALDLLCRNEVSRADGFDPAERPDAFVRLTWWQRATRHLLHWADLKQA